jgi:hypothetical protein
LASQSNSKNLALLSQLLLRPMGTANPVDGGLEPFLLPPSELDVLLALADKHHVIIRAFQVLQEWMTSRENHRQAEWAANAIAHERARIHHALPMLAEICEVLETEGCDVVVIKSLDHWPDLGSDLDLYTSAPATRVVSTMAGRFQAHFTKRSWGDRLANKWNFSVPGLRELIEVHVGRLGQTGEQVAPAHSLIARAQRTQIGSYTFRVPSPEDRLIVTTLQRMYRHFYLRLCDIVDTAQLLETGAVNYVRLRSRAETAGLWKGVTTFLSLVSDYVERYQGKGVMLPGWIKAEAQLSGDQLALARDFLRIPIVPHSMKLYIAELGKMLQNRELQGMLRLSLLPGLATAAALSEKITGSDKGIW